MQMFIKNSHNITGIVKPYAPLYDLAKNIFSLTLKFTKHDCVVVCLNIEEGMKFTQHNFKEILAVGKVTNLILYCAYGSLSCPRVYNLHHLS